MSFFSFDITRSGLNTAQKALKVSQNNIANVNTPGYAREDIIIGQNSLIPSAGLDAQIGAGSIPIAVNRIVDEYLIQQSRNENGEVGYYSSLTARLSEVETILNESGTNSISTMLRDFFNAFEEASKFPEDVAFRQTLVGKAEGLSDVFNAIGNRLNEIKNLSDDRIESAVKKINTLTEKVAELNGKIRSVPNGQANPLMDERDRYIDELSKYIDIDVSFDEKGIATISSGNGLLLSHGEAYQLKGVYDNVEQTWMLASGSGGLVRPNRGELVAEIEVRNGLISKYEDKINTLVNTLITEVNNYHTTGFGLDGSTGNTFFVGANAGTIRVNSTMKQNPEMIALSNASGKTGNSDVGELIAGLREEQVMSGGTESLLGYHQRFVFDMATDLNVTTQNEEVHQNILTNIETQRNDKQGVNIDEEMMTLLKYQRMYEANAKTLQSINTIFDSLLNIIR